VKGRDVRSGDKQQVGARVDAGVYQAFLDWVEETQGRHHGEVGEALTRAMMEYMDDERVEDELTDLRKTVRHNNAMLKKVQTELEKKQKEGVFSDGGAPNRGNAPGDRQKREALVIKSVTEQNLKKISQKDLKKAIRAAADVSSDPTVQDYVEALSQTDVFNSARTADVFEINHEAAARICQQRGVPLNDSAGLSGVSADD
jgi:hypothetical protein